MLPLDALEWDDFERLNLRMLQSEAEIIHFVATNPTTLTTSPETRLYGLPGQGQSGIDIFARDSLLHGEELPRRRYVCLQSRRTKGVTKADLRRSVDEFLNGRWAPVSRKFIYSTSASARSTELLNEIDQLASSLITQSIEFEVWDQETISVRLKVNPELVDDFWGREWVAEFCGDEAAGRLSSRLDGEKVVELRHSLSRIYSAAFGVADSGLLAFRFSESRAIGLPNRFVTPDLISTSPQSASYPQSERDPGGHYLARIHRRSGE